MAAAPDLFLPDVTVAALVERDGRFLMVEESIRGRRVLNQPAGHLEPGESLVEAMARETLEETGWTVRPLAFIGNYLWTSPHDGRNFLRFAFAAEALSHDPARPLDAGILAALWLGLDELRQRRDDLRSPLVLAAVEDFLGGRRLPLDAIRRLA